MDSKPTKVKLKLIQPAIICDGRDRIECYYRAKVVEWLEGSHCVLDFKYNGVMSREFYDFKIGFLDPELSDIKIVE